MAKFIATTTDVSRGTYGGVVVTETRIHQAEFLIAEDAVYWASSRYGSPPYTVTEVRV